MPQKPPLLTMREARERKLWFVSKHFGFGWVPIVWQGWVTLLVYIVLVVASAFLIFGITASSGNDLAGTTTTATGIPTNGQVILFFVILIIFTMCLVSTCIKKGEKARWRWGE